MTERLGRLPKEPVDRFTRPFTQFLRIEAAAGAVLLLCTALTLIVSNSPWSAPFLSFWETPAGFHMGGIEFSRSLKHWINDGLMTLFFFIVALELKREMALGELRNPRMAALSLAAAFGGMAVPASLFLLLAGGGAGAHGWGTVMATDTAFVIGCLAILGPRIPQSLRLFLLSLAIFDDIGAILVIAIAYGGSLNEAALGLSGLGLAVVAGMAWLGVRSILAYCVIGTAIWLAVDASGVHATLVGVILGLMTPTRSWVSDHRLRTILDRVIAYPPGDHWSGDTLDRRDLRRAGIATREALSPVERLEIVLHPWVAFVIMPLFALANAGLPISSSGLDGGIAMAIFVGFVFGKPAGVVLFSFLAVALRLAVRPSDLPWSMLAGGALLTGIGFTMALFIAELGFNSALLNSAKLGILGASVVSALCGLLVLGWLTSANGR
jgi:NhaA family Na+:H+ antiporter